MIPSAYLDDFAKRRIRYWHQDGLVDLILGLACTLVGIINLAGQALPGDYSLVAPLVSIGCFAALALSITPLKERITFPRTGYVAFRADPPTRKFRTASRIVGYLYMAVLFFLWHYASRFSGPFFALVMATALAVGGFQYTRPHWLWLAVLSLFLGAGCYALKKTGLDGMFWVMTCLGPAMALTGAWRLHSFLKSNPIPEDPAT